MSEMTRIAELRREITDVTLEILRLCGERLRIAEKMGEIKARRNLPVEDLKVEEELRDMVLKACRADRIDTGFCVKLLDLLIEESKKVQETCLDPKLRD